MATIDAHLDDPITNINNLIPTIAYEELLLIEVKNRDSRFHYLPRDMLMYHLYELLLWDRIQKINLQYESIPLTTLYKCRSQYIPDVLLFIKQNISYRINRTFINYVYQNKTIDDARFMAVKIIQILIAHDSIRAYSILEYVFTCSVCFDVEFIDQLISEYTDFLTSDLRYHMLVVAVMNAKLVSCKHLLQHSIIRTQYNINQEYDIDNKNLHCHTLLEALISMMQDHDNNKAQPMIIWLWSNNYFNINDSEAIWTHVLLPRWLSQQMIDNLLYLCEFHRLIIPKHLAPTIYAFLNNDKLHLPKCLNSDNLVRLLAIVKNSEQLSETADCSQ